MDDLKMLRDLGRDLEHEPPASLVRQRERMYGRRRRALSRPKNWLVLGAAAAVTASALLVPRLLFGLEPELREKAEPAESTKLTEDVNILVLGSDHRDGRNGERIDARSDTILVAHLSAEGRGAEVVSIPRDTLVDLPDCTTPEGRTVPGGRAAINTAFTIGGADCTRKAVERLSGLRLDHTVVFGFEAFKKAVDALGGVEITVTEKVDDPKAHLKLRKGRQTLTGEQALAYARVRYGLGDGSDLGRIERQQKLMAALVEKARSRMDDPVRLAKAARAVVSALEADSDLTAPALLRIIDAFARSEHRKIDFHTMPWKPAPEAPGRLVPRQPQADRLWQRLS